jgi:hypothetical protein
MIVALHSHKADFIYNLVARIRRVLLQKTVLDILEFTTEIFLFECVVKVHHLLNLLLAHFSANSLYFIMIFVGFLALGQIFPSLHKLDNTLLLRIHLRQYLFELAIASIIEKIDDFLELSGLYLFLIDHFP